MKTSSSQFVINKNRLARVQLAAAVAILTAQILILVNLTAQAALAQVAYVNLDEIARKNIHTNETRTQMKAALSQVVRQALHRLHRNVYKSDRSATGNLRENHQNSPTIEKRPFRSQCSILKQSNKML